MLNETALAELRHQFKTKTDLVHQTVAMHTYTTMLSHLQVDSYLYYMLRKNPVTMSVVVDESVTGECTPCVFFSLTGLAMWSMQLFCISIVLEQFAVMF